LHIGKQYVCFIYPLFSVSYYLEVYDQCITKADT
jgi:hypothetical protein